MMLLDLSLYLVLDRDLCGDRSMAETARAAVAGGATVVQLRDKKAGTEGLITAGREIRTALAGSGVPLIVNDDIEAALALDAEGVHVGQGDLPATEARRLMGSNRIVGVSVENTQAILAINPTVVDYVGVGPVFATATKPDHKPPIGFDGLARLVGLSPVPTVAISGLKANHVADVLDSGADGMAVVSAICGQPDPQAAAARISDEIRRWRETKGR